MATKKWSEVLDDGVAAMEIARERRETWQAERARIRAKLSEVDRKYLDEILRLFPNTRMVGIKFDDGEEIGTL